MIQINYNSKKEFNMTKRNIKMEVSLDDLNDTLELGIKLMRLILIVVSIVAVGLLSYALIL